MINLKRFLVLQSVLLFLFESPSVSAYTGDIIVKSQNQELLPLLIPVSSLCSTTFGKGLGSLKTLKTKVKEDIKLLAKKLESLGYFESRIDVDFKKTVPFAVTFIVEPRSLFKTTKILYECNAKTEYMQILQDVFQEIDLTKEFFVFQDYQNIRLKAEYRLKQKGFAHAKVALPELQVDSHTKEVEAIYPVQLGEIYHFGSHEIEGIPEGLDPALLERRLFWKKGDIFDISLIERSEEGLAKLQIFSVVSIETVDEGDHLKKMKIKLKEGKQRTISGVLRYFSTEQFGATLSWRHKNFFGNAEQFDIGAKFSGAEQGITATLLKPDFWNVINQKLLLKAGISHSEQLLFDTKILKLTTGLEHTLSPTLSSSALVSAEINMKPLIEATATAKLSEQWKELFYLPLNIKWDTRDLSSDPTKGWISSLEISPYFAPTFSSNPIQLQLQQTAYFTFGAVTCGSNLRLSTFMNTVFQELPAHKQYFGGGNGSVRGYASQTLSAGAGKIKEESWIPLQGARSKFEFTQEFRATLNEDFGIVGFIDLGIYSQHTNPFADVELMKATGFEKQASPMSISFGLGLNYLSLIGPVRVDMAFPLVTRTVEGKSQPIDNWFQFYIRFGQGF